ncbi:putative Transcription antitermination protein nusG [Magnetospirillum sp. XM-1]|uniref:transcription termination/antitermination protein NusG n=1 Tax=Magnetospirillum sp. XM-1 TaxID=1663591 RepID=UPI00073E0545|nr:transcription termination/antitermination NusG family protein [Magnetospirillum sp. XM-1]CUW37979.1 putative Transcription antitermination protein nusG [Magnetospirillum sp. XM-1]
MESWFVVHTHANAEKTAASHLQRQHFDIYLPQYSKRRSHARKVEWVKAPLFPRYLFLRMDPELTPWFSIRSTVGVHSLVCRGGMPVPLGQMVIDEIRGREDDSGLVSLGEAAPFASGQRLEIVEGPLAEQLGLFQGLDDMNRVVLLLDLLGRQVRVRVPLEAVRAGS